MKSLRNLSITVRLTLYFSIAMAIVLYSVSGLLYANMRVKLNKKDEQELYHSMRFQQEMVTAISEKPSMAEQWQKDVFALIAQQERLSLRIISPDGKIEVQSENMRVPPADFLPATATFRYQPWHYHAGKDKEKYLISATVFTLKNNQHWVVQAALNVSKNDEIIENYYQKMLLIAALAIILFSALGFWLARRGLSPLRTISAEMEKIHADDLHTRLSPQSWPTELNALAASFDQMMMRLEASFKKLNRFSSDISHELRAPINNLISAASVTQSKDRSHEEYQETLAAIVEEGERLSRMVSSMLFLARADNSREPLTKEWLNSRHEFEKLIDFYDVLAEEKNITLLSQGDVALLADPQLLQRALSNLLSNAIRHTDKNGEIILNAASNETLTWISIEDNGEGIAAEHLPLIFDRFYRIEAARSMTENTGLGLAIVKTIAEIHGGKIVVESEPGKGSKFILILPKPQRAMP